ncbi:MAG: hypothetical protein JKY21_06255 [Alcanivorax sp.]|nr:hypothetical protein [Alcanivorax sp.]
MNKLTAFFLLLVSLPCISAEINDEDVALWERCYELVELHRNMGGFFTTSLKESAYAGSCSGTLKTLSMMSAYTNYRCDIPGTSQAASIVVKKKVVTIEDALDLFCRRYP